MLESPWIFTWGALGIPKLELLPLLLLLISRPPRSLITSSTQNSTESSVRSVSIIKQITTLSTVANQFIFCFYIVYTVIYLFHGLIHRYKSIVSSKQANYASKIEYVLNRTVCNNMNVHRTFGTPKILPKLGKINNL